MVEDLEGRIRTMEKHLHAEKQLTATLEEALVDLETQSNKIRTDVESWKKKAWQAEEELQNLKKERRSERSSIQAVEEEKNKRREAEAARAHLEERMQALSRKKKKNALNCF
jgi:chromosome segregation ATPase